MYRVGFFVTVVLGALFCMCSVNCLVRSSVTQCFLCVVLPFVTLVSRALFGISFLDSLLPHGLAHCFVYLFLNRLVR